ncbi:MAG: hypothetical protein C4517_10010, partial [Stygiobacter sp.]
MNLNFFGNDLPDGEIKNRLTENGFDNKFSFKHKFYYSAVRPFIPINIRQLVQERVNKKIDYQNDFIWNEFVELVVNSQQSTVDSILLSEDCELKTED